MEDKLSKTQLFGFFQQEFDDRSTVITNNLLELEAGKDNSKFLKTILREVHGLKGSSKMVGLTEVAQLVHKWEDLFKDISNDQVAFSDEMLNLSLLIIDSIAEDVEKQISGDSPPASYNDILGEIERLRSVPAPEKKNEKEEEGKKSEDKAAPEKKAPEEKKKKKTERIAKTAASKSTIGQEGKKSKVAETNITVPVKKINSLIDSLGQIIIKDNFLANIEKRLIYLQRLLDTNKNQKDLSIDLKETIKMVSREVQSNKYFTRELKQDVLSLKMIPVQKLTAKFPRMVYEISQELNKRISFDIVGNNAEIEAEVFDRLTDPLLHMIRNSIDHGIEPSEERDKLGKPPIGIIHVSFEQTSDNIIIRCRDDGKGLSREKLLKKAIDNGVVTEKEAKNLTDSDIFYFIFSMGFSTKEKLSELSGRGIGMNVVKTIIVDELKGRIEIDNRPGEGVEFVLYIPLTLSILNVLLFEGTDDLFGIPIDYIRGIFHRSRIRVKTVKKRNYIEFEGSLIPLYSFSQVVGQVSPYDEDFILIGEFNFIKFAFTVENIVEKISAVIKKLNPPISDNSLYLGSIILGNGKLTPILDPEYFSQDAAKFLMDNKGLRIDDRVSYRILVVDDSITTRTIEKNLLVELGYEVDEAADGAAALELVLKNHYDLIFSDVQMPVMDGAEFLMAIRRRKKSKTIPFVFVSTVDSSILDVPVKSYQSFIKKRDFTVKKLEGLLRELL